MFHDLELSGEQPDNEPAPGAIDLDIPSIPQDEAPDVPEYACEECGRALEYSGRGRPPTRCDEHKKNRKRSTPASGTKRDNAIAREAADVLAQINGLIGIGLLVAPAPYKFPATAAKLDEVAPKFDAEVYKALQASPTLARSIARAGGVSGAAGLIIAYGMLGASLAPIALMEWQANRAAKDGDEQR